MRGRTIRLGIAATALLAMSAVPAFAQVDDFLCSTFGYKCASEAPPPPPQLAPEAAPVAETTKPHKKKMKAKPKKAKAAKTESTAAPAPAPDAAK